MYLPLYYCDCKNFGDLLNEILFRRLAGCDIKIAGWRRARMTGIGSILDDFLYKRRQYPNLWLKKVMQRPDVPIAVFSSGFGFDNFAHPVRSRKYIQPCVLKRRFLPFAIRGKLSLNQLEKISGRPAPSTVLGDGGLLCPFLANIPKRAKKYALGIVPHYADAAHPIFKKIARLVAHSKILDARKSPLEFLTDISECKTVLSTAMHPLIAADSLGIPNMWARTSEDTTSIYKFADYYSAFDMQKAPLYLLSETDFSTLPENISAKYDVPQNAVHRKQEELLEALKKAVEFAF